MAFHVLDPDLADFLNGLDDEHVHQLFDVKAELLESRYLVLYGNEEMYLLAYARAMVCKHFGQDVLDTELQEDDTLRAKSNYHYELDYGPGCIDFVKSIIKNANLTGRKRVFVIRGLAGSPNQQQLKHLMDSNSSYVIVSKTVGNIDPSILSRSLMLRLAFDKARVERFLSRYGLSMPKTGESLLRAIGKVKETHYEKSLKELLHLMQREKNNIKVSRAIKDYCNIAYQKCIPIAVLGMKIVDALSTHPMACEMVTACAKADHNAQIGTKELLNYEEMFVNVWHFLTSKK